MDMKNYLKQATREEREALAIAAKTSVAYLYLIGGRHRRPGTDLCRRLVAADPKLTLQDLRADIWAGEPMNVVTSTVAPHEGPQPTAAIPPHSVVGIDPRGVP